jgi:hypothetical protein
MAVETLSGVPCHFESGNTVIFEEVFSDFPASSWAATLCLSRNGAALAPITASESGDTFTFTISATVSAAFTAGLYDFAIYVASGSERTTAKTGQIEVLPNLATSQSEEFEEAQVTLLKGALAALNATDKQSVSFNGQSFTRASIPQYRQELVYWESRVIGKQRRRARMRGEQVHTSFGPRFCQ